MSTLDSVRLCRLSCLTGVFPWMNFDVAVWLIFNKLQRIHPKRQKTFLNTPKTRWVHFQRTVLNLWRIMFRAQTRNFWEPSMSMGTIPLRKSWTSGIPKRKSWKRKRQRHVVTDMRAWMKNVEEWGRRPEHRPSKVTRGKRRGGHYLREARCGNDEQWRMLMTVVQRGSAMAR